MYRGLSPFVILVAEDAREDRSPVCAALEEAGVNVTVKHVGDGRELMAYLHRREPHHDPTAAPSPALILLDMGLTEPDGKDVLQEIKADPRLRLIPVVAFASREQAAVLDEAYDRGANACIPLPGSGVELARRLRVVYEFWFKVVQRAAVS